MFNQRVNYTIKHNLAQILIQIRFSFAETNIYIIIKKKSFNYIYLHIIIKVINNSLFK